MAVASTPESAISDLDHVALVLPLSVPSAKIILSCSSADREEENVRSVSVHSSPGSLTRLCIIPHKYVPTALAAHMGTDVDRTRYGLASVKR